MLITIITSLITMILSAALGYLINSVKNYKKKLKDRDKEDIAIKEALKYLIQSNLTNTYYAYEQTGTITDYCYRNWLNLFRIYKALGGNEYLDNINRRMEQWEIKNTDIL